ncbi:starch phosphorylase [Desulfatibacillum alkenivorans DSM 16219]|jgi:starch phosphorylase|uniref:Alpha-1,4 glucan phosphorylase n=1 Tax=Desulfatibacillum alkenivorans DSM 16219 TaxID=1121393 RepID=A0A1M6F7S2_9BACT|nr:glycogen/starch/alpha-glucan phosphorylase [Desulfatibacillum alkenivorans]SHI93730.1 starch phosphorylase [Desulfatibacillum alkenivorans DSM 16219]
MKNSALFQNWGRFKKGMDPESIQLAFANHLEYSLSKDQYTATLRDMYTSLALSIRDRLVERWIRTQEVYYEKDVKRVYYLSAEYLMGRVMTNNLINLGMYEQTVEAMNAVHVDFKSILEQEPDMGLGNGGLGRLAACFLDSMATLSIPAYGYGIRYEFGIFDQDIRNLEQVERPENWLQYGNPWEIARPEKTQRVRFQGRVEHVRQPDGSIRAEWVDTNDVIGVAYDTPINGYGNETTNTLRLWSARASKEFDLEYFQHGDYMKAVEEKNRSETISKVLYPNDQVYQGRELRLKQQYFFVSCSIQDIIRRYLVNHDDFDQFANKNAIHMNDTHPSLAVAELMRLLVDEYNLAWEKAWEITTKTCAYTNHTLLAEALEKWQVSMFENLLPRPLEIIYEINKRFLRQVSLRYPENPEKMKQLSLIGEGEEKRVRMAHLAIVGSHSVNGVAALHSRLLMERELNHFYQMFPERFNNKTNGVTPRRWLAAANPGLARLISSAIGEGWVTDLFQLEKLAKKAANQSFIEQWRDVKQENKEDFAALVRDMTGEIINPESIFDFQVKRIHEYKRQTLNILHVVYRWLSLKRGETRDYAPRTFFFGGKAAPGYYMAKLIIKFICHVADMINKDPQTNDLLKVIFLPNYRVSLAERIFPASDVSEQISTAGYEASGTSNMKFAMNGALTVGTADGANVEIREAVGDDNIFIFGLNAEEAAELAPRYNARDYLGDQVLEHVLNHISRGFFNPDDPALFHPLSDMLLGRDKYLNLADFQAYVQCQEHVDALYKDQTEWTKKCILNVARMGFFSSDRTILEYNKDIWEAEPVTVTRGEGETPDAQGGGDCGGGQ